MRILHVISSLDPRAGGPSMLVRRVIRHQVAAGHDVAILATDVQVAEPWEPREAFSRRMQADEAFAGAEVFLAKAYGRRRPWSSFATAPGCRSWLARRLRDRRTVPDVIQIHGFLQYATITAARLARRYGVPYLIEPYGCLDQRCFDSGHRAWKRLAAGLFLRRALRCAAAIQVASTQEAEAARQWTGSTPIRVIPHGVDSPVGSAEEAKQTFYDRFPQLRQRTVVTVLGRLHPIKRYDLVVRALGLLRHRCPNLALLLVGNDDGHRSALEQAAADCGVSERLVFAGFLDGMLREGALAVSDVLVQPSVHENFALTVVEAMVRGVPVIVTPGVATHEYVDATGAGRTVEGTPSAIASAIEEIISADRVALTLRGRRFAEQHLSWNAAMQEQMKLYESILSRRRSTAGASAAKKSPKICLVSSVGGHFRELLQLRPVYEAHEHFYVVNDEMDAPAEIMSRMIRIRHIERSWMQIVNFVEAARILRRERPDLIISTGASPAVPFAMLGRLMGIAVVFVEGSYAIERPTLTGRIMYSLRLANLFLYQWPGLKRYYPRATYGGLIF